MISAWEVYLFTRLDAVSTAIEVFMILSGILAIGLCCFSIAATVEEMNCAATLRKFAKIVSATCLCLIILKVAVPTTNQFAVIYLLPKIANNEQVQKVPENFVNLLNTKMEAWIADFEKDKKK